MDTFERRGSADRRGAERRTEPRAGSERRSSQRRHHHSRAGFAWKSFKRSVPFLGGLMVACVVVAFAIGIATRGVESMYRQWTIALTAMDNPTKLNKDQKDELKKMVKGKGDAKKAYDKMSAEEKAQAKQKFGNLSDDQKKQYRQMVGN